MNKNDIMHEIERKRFLVEAYRIFSDAFNYEESQLLSYIYLIKDMFKILKNVENGSIYISKLHSTINQLNFNKRRLLELSYGLNGSDTLTLEQIGDELFFKSEYSYQRISALKIITLKELAAIKNNFCFSYRAKIKSLNCEIDSLLTLTSLDEEEVTKQLNNPFYALKTKNISSLNFSEKTINHLNNYGIITILDLIKLTETGIRNISNLPRVCYEEIVREFAYLDAPLDYSSTSKEEILKFSVERLGLSIRVLNCLDRCFLKPVITIEDIINLGEEKLMHIRNIGTKSCDEIIQKISLLGFSLKVI